MTGDERSGARRVSRRTVAVGAAMLGALRLARMPVEARRAASEPEMGHLCGNAARNGRNDRLGPAQRPRPIWEINVGPGPLPPVIAGDLLVAGSSTGTLFGLDPATGATRLLILSPGEIRDAPAITPDAIILPGLDGVLRSFDRGTGRANWSVETGANWLTSPAVVPAKTALGALVSTPGRIYVACQTAGAESPRDIKNEVMAFALDDGRAIWRSEMIAGMNLSPVAVSDDAVYCGSAPGRGRVTALDRLTGALRWTYDAYDISSATPSFADDHVYYSSGYRISGQLVAIDAETGFATWTSPLSSPTMMAAPVTDTLVIQQDSNGLLAADRETGGVVWKSEAGGEGGSPVIGGTIVYSSHHFPTQRVRATDLASGNILWELDFDEYIWDPMTIAGGYLYIVTDSGRLIAYG